MLNQVLDLGATNPALLIVLIFYGLDWVATVPPTIKLAHRCFGPGQGSVVYGWLFAAHQLGGAFAAWFSATTRDSTGTFQLSYIRGGIMCVVAALGVVPYPSTLACS